MALLTKSFEEIREDLNYCPPSGNYVLEFREWSGMTTKPEKGSKPMIRWVFAIAEADDERAVGKPVIEYTIVDVNDPDASFKVPGMLAAVLGPEVFVHLTDEDISAERIRDQDISVLDEAVGNTAVFRCVQREFNGRKSLSISAPVMEDPDA